MIRLGFDNEAKARIVADYVERCGIRKAFVLSPERFRLDLTLPCECEVIEYADIIEYRYYYRLLQEIDGDVLLVINECLRTQNRHDLTYNCVRNFLQQTRHQIVFQYLPMIDGIDDFMTLVDFDTRSRWRREPWASRYRGELDIDVAEATPTLKRIDVETDGKTQDAYAKKKRQLIDGIGLKDPHTIPRNLVLMGGKAKLDSVSDDISYVGRNNRFNLPNLCTYREATAGTERRVFEFCHNFIEFADFLAITRQRHISALVTDLKVDAWYFDRFTQWTERLRDAYAAIHG